MTSFAVQTKKINKEFLSGEGNTQVLFDVDVSIPYGELTFLVGPSGCGKTTLLSIMTGILTPTSGDIWIHNVHLNSLSDEKKVTFRREYMGFVFQQFNLLPTLTAAENVAIPLIARGVPFHQAVEKAKDVMKKVDMRNHAQKYPSQLSGGQQQRVAFARALVHQPKVIVCDEPTASLDGKTGHEVIKILKEIAIQPDCAVLVVTHDDRIFSFADSIIHMNDGRITDAQ